MWRTVRIAYAGQSSRVRSSLSGLLARLGLQEQIDDIGDSSDAVRSHKEDPFEIIFIDALGEGKTRLELAKDLRAISDEAFLAIIVDALDSEAAAKIINEAHLDWILAEAFSDVELKNAMVAAMSKLETSRRRREMQLGRNVLRASHTAAAILNRNFHIIYSNRLADMIFSKGDPFQTTKSGQLVCNTSAKTQDFHENLRGALHKHFELRENAFIRVERDLQRQSVIVVSIPIQGAIDHRYTYHIVLNDLERQSEARVEDIATALRISTAEARLAKALARGLDLESASAESNISISTARSYLKSIFEKTGVTRQAELVRLALLAV